MLLFLLLKLRKKIVSTRDARTSRSGLRQKVVDRLLRNSPISALPQMRSQTFQRLRLRGVVGHGVRRRFDQLLTHRREVFSEFALTLAQALRRFLVSLLADLLLSERLREVHDDPFAGALQ